MSSQANVKSIQVLAEFRNALGLFHSETQQSLDTIARQIRRFEEWLTERQRYWRQQVEYCQEEVYRAQGALEDCLGDEDADCSAYEDALAESRHALREAEEELSNVQHWRNLVAQAVADYQRQAVRLTQQLQQDVPKAGAFLGQKIAILEAYRAESPVSGGVTSTTDVSSVMTSLSDIGQTTSFRSERESLMGTILQIAHDNPVIPASYKQELHRAIDLITQITPDALGLVKRADKWGPYASTIQARLSNTGTGDGFAYELLGTAALLETGSIARNSEKRLSIDPETDRIDFEIKLNPRETVPPSDRKTVEADLLIHRRIYQDNQWKDSREIGVDFKHVRDGGVSNQKLEAEIEGIKTVIKTGQIHEFHFVTNGKFSKAQINAIHEANEVLQQDGFEYGAIAYHEQVKFGNL